MAHTARASLPIFHILLFEEMFVDVDAERPTECISGDVAQTIKHRELVVDHSLNGKPPDWTDTEWG